MAVFFCGIEKNRFKFYYIIVVYLNINFLTLYNEKNTTLNFSIE
jgi:hypothetical protein